MRYGVSSLRTTSEWTILSLHTPSYIWPRLWHRWMGRFRTGEKVPSASGLQPNTWNKSVSFPALSVPACAQLWYSSIFDCSHLCVIYGLLHAFYKSLSWRSFTIALLYKATLVLRRALSAIISCNENAASWYAMKIAQLGWIWFSSQSQSQEVD